MINKIIQGVKAIIKNNQQDKYLLAQHNTTNISNKGKWTFLGGCIDENDSSHMNILF